jgi:peptidyl-prolyl cis-trans isomerase C
MLKVVRNAALALALASCAAAACRKGPAQETKPADAAAASDTKPAEPAKPAEPPPKPVPPTLPPVIARVNGEEVSKDDLDRLVTQMEVDAGMKIPPDRRDEIYRKAIDQLVTYTLLVQETKTRKVEVSEADAKKMTDARIADLRKQVPNADAFNKALAARNMTLTRLRSDIRKDIAINRMLQQELSKLPAVSEADMKDYYAKNPDQFRGVRASHILIRPEGFDDASKKKARARIDDLLKQARAGSDFGDLARKNSADGSAQAGGDLGYFTKEAMVPEFSKAAFALEPGQISDVVETQFGYHIIKVTEKKELQFPEVAEKLRGMLTERRQGEAQEAFIKSLKDKARIEVLV